jgi:glycosyltransferase involved in cell wall biosynthesis
VKSYREDEMKVGFNCRYLERESWTGTEQYLFNLLRGLDNLAGGPDMDLFGTNSKSLEKKLHPALSHAVVWPRRTPAYQRNEPGRLWWDLNTAGQMANRVGVEVFHGTSFSLPQGLKMPAVVTFFDLAFLRHSDFYSWKENIYLRWMIRRSASVAKAIITISEFSKSEIVSLLDIDPARVHAIPLGVSETVSVSKEEQEEILTRYGLKSPYLLTVSTVTARKNLKMLLDALKLLSDKHGSSPVLCIAGRDGFGAESIKKHCHELGLGKNVVFTGSMPKKDLDALQAGAAVALVPSKYEGFGLPVLEAMAAGIPVIAANASALPEVAGTAGLLADPDNPAEWAGKMAEILNDSGLRDKLKNEGYKRAGTFSWQTTATRTCEVYERISA